VDFLKRVPPGNFYESVLAVALLDQEVMTEGLILVSLQVTYEF